MTPSPALTARDYRAVAHLTLTILALLALAAAR